MLAKLDPRYKLGLALSVLSQCLYFSDNLVSLVCLGIMLILTFFGGVSLKKYLYLWLLPWFFILPGVLALMLTSAPDSAWAVQTGGLVWGFSQESFDMGLNVLLRSLGSVSCMYFIMLTCSVPELLLVLQGLKVPSLILNLMEMLFRYIAMLLDLAEQIKNAQQSRLGYASFGLGLSSLGKLAGSLFIQSCIQSGHIYQAMESRGWQGEFFRLRPVYVNFKFFWLLALTLNLGILALGLRDKI